MTDPSAIQRLADAFSTTPTVVGLWICALSLLVIVLAWSICIRIVTAPAPEGRKPR